MSCLTAVSFEHILHETSYMTFAVCARKGSFLTFDYRNPLYFMLLNNPDDESIYYKMFKFCWK